MGQINTNNYPAVDSLLDADLLIVENATHGTGTTTPKQLRENAIGTDPLQTTAQTVTGAINEVFEMAGAPYGLELGKMTSFTSGTITTDIDLHREPAEGDRILFYHNSAVASPSNLTTYNDGVAVTKSIMDFSMTHPIGLTLMEFGLLGWTTVQDIAAGGYTAGTGISINGTTINNSAPQLGDDIAYSRIDTVTSGALGYFSADADCLVMDFRTDAEPYNGGYTLRLTTTGASFKYAVLKDKAGNNYSAEIPSGSLVLCKSNVSGTGSEADPVVVTVLEIGNTEMAHDVEVLKDICITEKTASGNPITLTDALPYAALSLSADIEPIQDLHGYDKPWVGGAGKQLIPLTVANIKALNTGGTWNGNIYTVNSGTIEMLVDDANNVTGFKINGQFGNATTNFRLVENPPFDNVAYKISGAPVGSAGKHIIQYSNFVNTAYQDTGSGADFTGQFDYQTYPESRVVITIYANVNANNVIIRPMICLANASDPTTFAPYSNICPISGRTEVTAISTRQRYSFEQGGLNDANGSEISSTTRIRTDFIPCDNISQIYYMGIDNDVVCRAAHWYDSTNNWISATFYSGAAGLPFPVNATPPNNAKYIRVVAQRTDASQNITPDGRCILFSNETASAIIQLGQTVYGGTVNVTTGELTVDRVSVAPTEIQGVNSYNNIYYWQVLTGLDSVNGANVISSHFKSKDALETGCTYVAGQGKQVIAVPSDQTLNTKALADAWMVANAPQFVYKLATPIELTLTPVAVEMLKGYNQISSNGGGDITLTYRADRLAAIEAALAELQ